MSSLEEDISSSALEDNAGPSAATNGDSTPSQSAPLILRISKKSLPKASLVRSKRPLPEVSEPGYMLHPPKISRRRRKGGRGTGVELASILEKALEKVKSHPYSGPFLYQVTAREAPDYHKVIKRPMYLTKIQEKLKGFQYVTHKQFLDDIRLMVDNCHKYCETRFPHLPPMADLLLTICEDQLKLHEQELLELENGTYEEDEGGVPVAQPRETSATTATTTGSATASKNSSLKGSGRGGKSTGSGASSRQRGGGGSGSTSSSGRGKRTSTAAVASQYDEWLDEEIERDSVSDSSSSYGSTSSSSVPTVAAVAVEPSQGKLKIRFSAGKGNGATTNPTAPTTAQPQPMAKTKEVGKRLKGRAGTG